MIHLELWPALVGLGCGALSLVTWFLFQPRTTFHPPQSRAMTVAVFFCMAVMVGATVLNLANAFPLEFFPGLSKELPDLGTALFLTLTYGRAVRHHIQNATRTPRDLWTAFFRG